jgi:hypothetical protein
VHAPHTHPWADGYVDENCRALLRCPGPGHYHDDERIWVLEFRANGERGEPVSLYFRYCEDDPAVELISEAGAAFSGVGPTPPSSRRGSVMLVYECETHSHRFGLTFEQHKGQECLTLVTFGSADLAGLDYADYLRTPEWQDIRALALRHYGASCVLCGTTDGLQVHHRRYPERGTETVDDLIVLCDDCHAHHHGKDGKAA